METYIEKLHARGVGMFEELDIEFNKRFNFIIGPNGSGKTTILRTLALTFEIHGAKQLRYNKESEFWSDFIYDTKRMRCGIGKGWSVNENVYKKTEISEWAEFPGEYGRTNIFPYQLEDKKIPICPLFFGAYRKISYTKIGGVSSETDSMAARNNYRNSYQESLNGNYLPNVKQWLINRYFQIDKDWAIIEKTNWEWLLKNLYLLSPTDAKLKFIKIERDLEPVFEINGIQCYLEEISAGFQAILALVFSIINWIEDCNEKADDRLVANAVGSIIIDEFDAHLHPEWQFIIRDSFDKLFPKLQFITTTHSPHLIASAKENEVIVLPEISGIINVKPSTKKFSGWDTDSILTDLMGVKNIYSMDYDLLLKEALDFAGRNDPENLKLSIEKLKAVTSPNDSLIENLEIKYAELLLKKG